MNNISKNYASALSCFALFTFTILLLDEFAKNQYISHIFSSLFLFLFSFFESFFKNMTRGFMNYCSKMMLFSSIFSFDKMIIIPFRSIILYSCFFGMFLYFVIIIYRIFKFKGYDI